MKIGAEPKKISILAGLLVVAVVVYLINSSSDPAPVPVAKSVVAVAPPGVAPVVAASDTTGAAPALRREATGRGSVNEFDPRLGKLADPSKVDPSLRLDLLAKVQAVAVIGGGRNIFKIVDAPIPQPKPPVPIPIAGKIDPTKPPGPPVTIAGPPPGPPPAPPINLKYYGYSSNRTDGNKRAFFLDGDDIIVAAEGDTVKKRYKLLKIGVNSVQMEDTVLKSTQTLPLLQEAAAA